MAIPIHLRMVYVRFLQQQSRVVEAETNMTCKAENVHCLALYKNSFPTPGI